MHKAFEFHIHRFMYLFYLRKRKFTRHHDPGCPVLHQKLCALRTGNRHLRAGMKRKIRELCMQKVHHAKILHDQRIDPVLIIGKDIIV